MNNNTNMQQPPNVLSGKDCNYITDMLSWNLALCKQANSFKHMVQDMEIAQELDSVAKMHEKHYDTLLNILQNNNN